MGQELSAVCHWQGRSAAGKAHLEGDHLLFRGDFRLRISFASLTGVAVEEGRLRLLMADGTAELELGAKAADWAERIRNPKSVLDKLGIGPGVPVTLLGAPADPALTAALAKAGIEPGPAGLDGGVILLTAAVAADLAAVADAAAGLGPKAALWIVYPRGRRDITQADVFAAGKGAGLVDTKVCAVSPTATALRFVRRKAG